MSPPRDSLPAYLQKYAAVQNYEKYTAEDHAAWRFIMRQNRAFFSKHAVPIYVEGLRRTGIPLDRIPRIDDMHECLSQFGWGAVPVVGFIPPAAFLEFQALGVLPIACDMRTIHHVAYTPAPDIVHEAAGHAPIIADPNYAAYLHRYARMAQKAIQSIEDIRVYEAIRYLSDLKENPDTKPEDIARAEQRLRDVSAAVTHTSEGTKVARMAWWTVEYGLVGDLKSPVIYGAGLLSSVGESQHCLSKQVKKIPLSVDCVKQSYNITEPQPQLFVARSLDHLVDVLEALEKTLAFRIGGVEGLKLAKSAETVNTIVLDTGLEVSGKLTEFLDDKGAPLFFKMTGPVHLAVGGRMLPSHGRERHAEGFSAPLGRLEGLASPSDDQLKKATELRFSTGFVLKGRFLKSVRRDGKLLLATFGNATLSRQGEAYFQPEWGEFDLALGSSIPSVYGGPADRSVYLDLDIGQATTNPGRATPFTEREKTVHGLYQRLRKLRENGVKDSKELEAIGTEAADRFSDEWLVGVEVLELANQKFPGAASQPWAKRLRESLDAKRRSSDDATRELIDKGLALLSTPD